PPTLGDDAPSNPMPKSKSGLPPASKPCNWSSRSAIASPYDNSPPSNPAPRESPSPQGPPKAASPVAPSGARALAIPRPVDASPSPVPKLLPLIGRVAVDPKSADNG